MKGGPCGPPNSADWCSPSTSAPSLNEGRSLRTAERRDDVEEGCLGSGASMKGGPCGPPNPVPTAAPDPAGGAPQ